MKNQNRNLILLVSTLLLLSGCSSGSNTPSPTTMTPSPSMSSSQSSDATLKTVKTTLGEVLVASNGRTIYFFTQDKKDSGVSTCLDNCRKNWPPVLVDNEPSMSSSISSTIGTIPDPSGKKQVTVDGMPVYYWYQDQQSGDVKGQGVGNVWYVISPNGTMIKDSNPTSSSSPTQSQTTSPTPTEGVTLPTY